MTSKQLEHQEITKSRIGYLKALFFSEFDSLKVDNVEVDFGGIRFNKEGKQIFQIYTRENWENEALIDELELSYYTTTDRSDFELKRVIELGKLADLLLTNKKLWIKKFQEAQNYRKDELKQVQKEIWKEREMEKIKEKEEKQLKLNNILASGEWNSPNGDVSKLYHGGGKWDNGYVSSLKWVAKTPKYYMVTTNEGVTLKVHVDYLTSFLEQNI